MPESQPEPETAPQTEPETGPQTLPTRYGDLSVPDWPEDIILRVLALSGEWGAAEVALLAPLVDPGEVFWDVGAFLGTFSLGLAQHTAPGSVLAVEANAALVPYLNANLGLLPCPGTVARTGIAARSGWIAPISMPENNQGATHYAFQAKEPPEGPSVRAQSLADLRAEHGDYDVLKLDLENMEAQAIVGDAAYIRARQPVIWAECNEDLASLRLYMRLSKLGYNVLYLAFPAIRRDSFRPVPEDQAFRYTYEAALLAAPPDRLARLVAELPEDEVILRRLAHPGDLRRALYDTPRYCLKDWRSLSKPELIARLCRARQDQGFAEFLRPPPKADTRCSVLASGGSDQR